MGTNGNSTPMDSKTDVVLISDSGICKCCSQEAYDDEIIQCALCKDRFHAICKDSTVKICSSTFLTSFMRKSTKNNFIWLCDPCLVKFEVDHVSNEQWRIDTLEEKYNKIEHYVEDRAVEGVSHVGGS